MKFGAFALAFFGCVASTEAVTLRFLGRSPLAKADPTHEVVSKESFKRVEHDDDCMCPEDSFWHFRIKECIKRGGLGYECGFFPKEHQNVACHDGLVCKALPDSKTQYFHPGALPASCRPCEAADNCPARRADNCSNEFSLSGKACATVRAIVGVKADGSDEKTISHTAEATATATAEATATHGEGDQAVTKTITAEHTATAKVTVNASTTGTGLGQGVAEKTACVELADVMAKMGLEKTQRFGEKIAAQIIAQGDAMAAEGALAQAVAEAQQLAAKSSQQVADKAEDKTKSDAQDKAEEQAKAEASKLAEDGAKEKAEEAAKAAAKEAFEAMTTTPAAPAPAAAAAAPAPAVAPPPTTTVAVAPTTAAPPPTTVSAAPTTAAPPPTTVAAAPTTAAPPKPEPPVPQAPPKMVQPAADPQVELPRKITQDQMDASMP